jgi:hypothetical protein
VSFAFKLIETVPSKSLVGVITKLPVPEAVINVVVVAEIAPEEPPPKVAVTVPAVLPVIVMSKL